VKRKVPGSRVNPKKTGASRVAQSNPKRNTRPQAKADPARHKHKSKLTHASIAGKTGRAKNTGPPISVVESRPHSKTHKKRKQVLPQEPAPRTARKPDKRGIARKESAATVPARRIAPTVKKAASSRAGNTVPRRSLSKQTTTRVAQPQSRRKATSFLRVSQHAGPALDGGASAEASAEKTAPIEGHAKFHPAADQSAVAVRSSLSTIPSILLEGDQDARTVGEPAELPHASAPVIQVTSKTQETLVEQAAAVLLPAVQGSQEVFVVFCDPHCLHVSWDFTREQWTHWQDQAQGQKLWLRLFDASNLSKPLVQEGLGSTQRQLFVPIDHSGMSYHVQIGGFNTAGVWQAIATSTPISPPRTISGEEEDPAWTSASEFTTATFTADASIPATSREPITVQARPSSGAATSMDAAALENEQAARACVNDSDKRTVVPVPSPQPEPAALEPKGELESSQERTGPEPDFIAPTPVFLSEQIPSGAPSVSELPGPVEDVAIVGESRQSGVALVVTSEKNRDPGNDWKPEPVSPSWQDPLSTDVFPSEPPPSAGDAGSSYGEAPGRIEAPRKFWFNVHAEVVIYGATEPDATVTLAGRTVELRPDGTFSIRFALPDGIHSIEASATSGDGFDRRTARLTFQRSTEYWEHTTGEKGP
jgi:hypothetical protein